MKKVLVLMSAFALVFTACQTDGAKTDGEDATGTGQTEQPKKVGKKIRTESDSLSYAVGIDLGNHLKNNIKAQVGDDLNNEMVFAAIKDVFSDKGTLTMDESYNFLNEYFSIRIPEKKKAEGKKFLEEVEKKNPNIKKTESGMLYEIIEQGSDVRATDLRDQVRVAYRGTLKDGTEFDSSYERGDTAQFALNGVIKGWGEGLQLIGEGGKIKLWIPEDLGYGQYGGGQIGPYEPLIFDVELFEVIPAETEE